MNELKLILKKDFIKIFSPIINIRNKTKSKESRNKIIIWIVLIPSFIILFKTIGEFVSFMYDSFLSVGKVESIFNLVLFSSIFMLLLNVLPYSLSKLYYNKDIEFTLSLPINGKNILISSMIQMLILETFWVLILFLPAMIKIARARSFPLIYYLANIVNILFYLLGLLAIVSLLWIVIMKFLSKFSKIKALLQIIFMFATIVLVLLMQKVSTLGRMNIVENSANIAQNHSLISIDKFIEYMPQNTIVLKPFYDFNASSILIALVFSIAFGILLTIIASHLAYKPWLAGYNNFKISNVKKIKKEKLRKYIKYKEKSIIFTLIKKEVLNIVKTPVYFFNIAFAGILIPIMLIIPIVSKEGIRNKLAAIPELSVITSELGISNFELTCITIVAGMAIGMLFCMGGTSVSTSVSREGKQIYLMQALAISPKEQVFSRVIAGTVLSLLESLPLLIIIIVFLKAPIYLFLFLIIGVLIISLAVNSYCLLIDIIKPKLLWKDPQGAVKQNFNVVINILINFGYIALTVWLFKTLMDNNVFSFASFHIFMLIELAINFAIIVTFMILNIKTWKNRISKYNVD